MRCRRRDLFVDVGEVSVVNVAVVTVVVSAVICSGLSSAHIGTRLTGIALGSSLLIELCGYVIESLLQIILSGFDERNVVLCDSVSYSGYLCGDSALVILAELVDDLEDALETARQYEWLTSTFGDGEYTDVLCLCKIAIIQEIEEKNYSLTPGAYVGVAEQEDDGVEFHERMTEIHSELAQLNSEANALMDEIQKAWEELK